MNEHNTLIKTKHDLIREIETERDDSRIKALEKELEIIEEKIKCSLDVILSYKREKLKKIVSEVKRMDAKTLKKELSKNYREFIELRRARAATLHAMVAEGKERRADLDKVYAMLKDTTKPHDQAVIDALENKYLTKEDTDTELVAESIVEVPVVEPVMEPVVESVVEEPVVEEPVVEEPVVEEPVVETQI